MKHYLVIFSTFLFCCCLANEPSIERVKVYYMNPGNTFAIPPTCDNVLVYKHLLKDSLITISTSLRKLEGIMNGLEIHEGEVPEWNIEIRKKIFIRYTDNSLDTLCLGKSRGVILNGVRMKESTELHELFDF
jgi:hypothetical protein